MNKNSEMLDKIIKRYGSDDSELKIYKYIEEMEKNETEMDRYIKSSRIKTNYYKSKTDLFLNR